MKQIEVTQYISPLKIKKRVRKLGKIITQNIDEETILLIVMDGAFIFAADLIRNIKYDCKIFFISAQSYYEEEEPTDEVILDTTKTIPKNKNILIIDDVCDTGTTLNTIFDFLYKNNEPLSIQSCVLFNKPKNRKIEVFLNYIGFTMAEGFLFGYGMDYEGRKRTVPYVGQVSETHTN